MRRLPYELYGASALMAAAMALLVRVWLRERNTARNAARRWYGSLMHRSA